MTPLNHPTSLTSLFTSTHPCISSKSETYVAFLLRLAGFVDSPCVGKVIGLPTIAISYKRGVPKGRQTRTLVGQKHLGLG